MELIIICFQVLGLLKCTRIGKRRIPSVPDDSDEEFDDDNYEQLLNLRADIVDESDRIPHTSSDFLYDDYAQHVSAKDIKDVLLGSHQFILEDILISLLCLDNGMKWNSYSCRELYEFAFSSIHNMYAAMTNYDLDIVINVLRKWECKEFPLGMKLNESKVKKINQLGFIFAHTDYISPRKPVPKMKPLVELCLHEAKNFIPTSVLRVALATFDFRIKLPLWMDKSTVPITYEIPVEPHTFDVFSYPEFSFKCQQLEPRVIDPSHVLT